MKFKKLKLKNIRSYEDQEINFTEGALLLSGDVGSGKTSVLLAIEYALFGLQPGQKGASLLRNNAKTGEVSLECEIDGKIILIERRLKRSNKSIGNEYASIIIDGEKTESSVTEIKTKILQLLGYPQEFIKKNNLLYRYTVYTPQEQMKQIILEDPETRLNILRHVFGIDKYKRIRENLTIFINFLKEKIKILQNDIKDLERDNTKLTLLKDSIPPMEHKISINLSLLEDKKKSRRNIEFEVEELSTKIKEKFTLDKEIEKTKVVVESKKENIFNISREIEEIEKILLEQQKETFNETNYEFIRKRIADKKVNIEKLGQIQIDIAGQINSLKKDLEEKATKRERLFKIDICPTCLQDVPEFHKHNILNETELSSSRIKTALEALDRNRVSLSNIKEKEINEMYELEKEKSKLEIIKSKIEYVEMSKAKFLQLIKKKEELEKDITFLEKHIVFLKEEMLKFTKFDTQFRIKNDLLKVAFQEEKYIEISTAEYKKEIEMTSKEIGILEEIIKSKEQLRKELSDFLELNDWLSTQFLNLIEFTERNVLINLRREFLNLFNKWFQMLVSSESFQVNIDESFTPIIIQNETEMDYSFLSGGERTAVALAYRLALNQTLNSLLSQIKTKDIIILDEPTDGFSDIQLDKMREVLQELNASQIIIVSHEQKIESFVNNILKIRKNQDVSQIESPISLPEFIEPNQPNE